MVKRVMGPTVKDSPPISPEIENVSGTISSRRKRKSTDSQQQQQQQQQQNMMQQQQQQQQQSTNSQVPTPPNHIKDEKESKLFQNNILAPHMMGNQLNPSSTMAQKMSESLSQELEAHSIFTEAGNPGANLIGPPLPTRVIESAKASNMSNPSASFSSLLSGNNGNGAIPQTLDQLLERQWEQGSQFLMEQAQHFDIASLLSCLHQLRAENLRLEEHVNSLLQRRDHLLAVNARLAIPLTTTPNAQHTVNNIHPNMNSVQQMNIPNSESPKTTRDTRVNSNYMGHTGNVHSVVADKSNMASNVTNEQMVRSQYSQRPGSNPPQQNSSMRY